MSEQQAKQKGTKKRRSPQPISPRARMVAAPIQAVLIALMYWTVQVTLGVIWSERLRTKTLFQDQAVSVDPSFPKTLRTLADRLERERPLLLECEYFRFEEHSPFTIRKAMNQAHSGRAWRNLSAQKGWHGYNDWIFGVLPWEDEWKGILRAYNAQEFRSDTRFKEMWRGECARQKHDANGDGRASEELLNFTIAHLRTAADTMDRGIAKYEAVRFKLLGTLAIWLFFYVGGLVTTGYLLVRGFPGPLAWLKNWLRELDQQDKATETGSRSDNHPVQQPWEGSRTKKPPTEDDSATRSTPDKPPPDTED